MTIKRLYMKSSSDKQLLEHLLGSIQIAQEIASVTEKKFDESILHRDALCHRFYNIGQAIDNLSKEFKEKYKESPLWLHAIWKHDFIDPYQLYTIAREKNDINASKTDLERLFEAVEKIYLNDFSDNDQ